jgi:anionic cell wall polymer biosynthesis LytR-Cps2A-Psr (LCP) family protein
MGLDLRPREGKAPSRSDTIFVLTVDPRSKTAGILGIPRDLYVEIPDGQGSYYEDRINTAFILGEMDKRAAEERASRPSRTFWA